jgi:GT2 family glycosyltransferase
MYSLKDISVIIPTYNRTKDLSIALKSLKRFIKDLREIIIVDQSTNKETKNLIKNMKNKKIRYIFSNTPSIPQARNIGIKNLSEKIKLVCFIDDDVVLKKDYFKEILSIFDKNPEAKAVAAVAISSGDVKEINKWDSFLRRIFFLEHSEHKKVRVLSAYGNTHPHKLTKIINSQWIPGVNMVYKKEVFNEQLFDGNFIGYSLAEDLDFSYRLYKKYPDSLFITPSPVVIHTASTVERDPTKKRAYVNQINHFYLNFKNFNETVREKLIFCWAVFGITMLRTIYFMKTRKKVDALKLKLFFKSLFYCITNLEKIRKGELEIPNFD